MSGDAPTFRAGEPPLARDFARLVAAIRQLQAGTPAPPPVHRTTGRMFLFPRAGSATAATPDGTMTARVTETLHQLGDSVAVRPGGTIQDVDQVRAAHPDKIIGLHGDGTTFEAVPWEEAVEQEDGSMTGEGPWHCAAQSGALLPAPGPRGNGQRCVLPWANPQYPMLVWRDYWWPEIQGATTLLPCGDFSQNLAVCAKTYTSRDHGVSYDSYEWRARLDKYGQLHIRMT